MFFFVGRLLLILLEQDCTCLPCNLLNTISSVYVRGCILYHDDMHPRWLWFSCIHFMWPTDVIKQTLPNLYWSWFFCRHCGRVSFLFSWILDCELPEWLVLSIQKRVFRKLKLPEIIWNDTIFILFNIDVIYKVVLRHIFSYRKWINPITYLLDMKIMHFE